MNSKFLVSVSHLNYLDKWKNINRTNIRKILDSGLDSGLDSRGSSPGTTIFCLHIQSGSDDHQE
jgi:hypothetical protein